MANHFGLFFSRDRTVIRLPVNPEELPEEHPGDTETVNVLGLGEVIIPRAPKLKTVTIESFFPGKPFPGVLTSGAFQPAEFYINFFDEALKSKKPIQYTPVRYYEDGTPFFTADTGFACIVKSFAYTEKGGETGDFYYTLQLTEWRDYSPRRVSVELGGKRKKASPEPTRKKPSGQITVGSICLANGRYYYSSYQNEPHGTANNRRVKVSRIVSSSRPVPIHITTESGGALGWIAAGDLQVIDG